MLCAMCISMFQNVRETVNGPHHESIDDLIAAAQSGCRICIYQNLRRERFGTEQDDAISERPILCFKFEPRVTEERLYWSVTFDSKASWARSELTESFRDSFDRITVHVHPDETVPIPPGYQMLLKAAKRDLTTRPWRKKKPWRVRHYGSQRPISSNTGDVTTMKIAENWVRECVENHKSCGNVYRNMTHNWYPKRLLAVGEDDRHIRLVVTAEECTTGVYAALSHCWGSNPSFLTLTSDNLEKLRSNIPTSVLPQSFRDMIIACRSLNIDHIWIDSLCIVQSGEGSEADWLLHLAEMGVIYSRCFVNLSIVHASGPDGGAFRDRTPTSLQDCYIWSPLFYPSEHNLYQNREWWYDKSIPSTTASTTKVEEMRLCSIFASCADFVGSGSNEPLNSRGWVLQERLLSPRTLHFQQDRIAWECGESARTEYFPYGLPCGCEFNPLYVPTFNLPLSLRNHTLPPVEPESEERRIVRPARLHPWSQHYWTLAEEYSGRELSFPDKDKLVAFSAVAMQFGPAFGNDYFAGIFKQDMPEGLLWTVIEGHRQSQWRAPSWSWASIDGRVERPVGMGMIEDGWLQNLVNLEDVQTEPADPSNRYGQVISGRIDLKGIVIPWRKKRQNDQDNDGNEERGRDKEQVCGARSTNTQPHANTNARSLDSSLGSSSPQRPYFEVHGSYSGSHEISRYDQGFEATISIYCDDNQEKTTPLLDECFLVPVFEDFRPGENASKPWGEDLRDPGMGYTRLSYGLVLLRQDERMYTRLGVYKIKGRRIGREAIRDGAKQQIISIL